MPYGWKAMSLVTRRVPGLLLAPSALAALALSRVPGVRRPVVSLALGQVSAAEAILDAELEDWRTYEISWGIEQVAFRVDGRDVFQADLAPNGPLGFVTWIDNQYAIVSPQEGIRFGVEELRANQRLELTDLSVSNSESITQA